MDSLIIFIDFEDGDGDIGLNRDETQSPYNERNVIRDVNGDIIYFRATREVDTLPDFNTFDWWVVRDQSNNNRIIDTILAKPNINHYNLFVDFYKVVNQDTVLFDIQRELGGPNYNFRIPRLFDDLSNDRALVGTIRYAMASYAWQQAFSLDTIQMKIQIQDRSLNRSNSILTPKFMLKDITVR